MTKYSIKDTDKKKLKEWLYLMLLGRKIDSKAPNYLRQALGWSYHAPYAGHDGIQLAIGQVFEKNKDHFFPYYRDMLSVISAGMSAEEIILNGISKDSDPSSGGRHMSNHFAKPEWNIHNVSSSTGNHVLHAAGVARAIKYYDEKAVAISSQGESSVSEGYVYEAINGAAKEQLPVVFVIQDNGYGISVPKKDQTTLPKSGDAFGSIPNLKIFHCNGKDVFDSMNTMVKAKEYALSGKGPAIVHASCVRIHSHSNSDRHELYRDDYELKYVKDNDPIDKFKRMLIRYKRLTEEEITEIDEKAAAELKKAHKTALKAKNPDPESIYDFLYAKEYSDHKYPDGLHNEKGESVKFIEALNTTLKEEFRNNPDTFIWGQDIANKDKGGIFNVSKGMQQEFGQRRVFNAPIAEDFILGTANGMSRYDNKIRIVVEGAEFADYFWPAMEQYVEMSHEYWRTKGKFAPNVTIRLASGGYIGGGLYHSQSTEGVLSAFPGMRVVYPSFADDAAGLLRTAMRSEGPTLFLEPKALYNNPDAATVVPEGFSVPFGKARLIREGEKAAIITYGNTTHLSLKAAAKLEKETGAQVAVLDLRSLNPLDEDAIINLVQNTGKILIVHEDKTFAGFGGELSALITEKAFEFLDAPVMRIGSENTPVGFNPVLEKAILPGVEKIYSQLLKLVNY
ncbi:MAG: 2-oxoisovalerate dehydrogenase [Marinilabiliales bacterium]|nr:MAG: 2-oxoisovalerate dehydrogenase [Marinilabiliales bacterium]